MGLNNVKRSVKITQHVKMYDSNTYSVPYVVEHFDENDQPLKLIPDVHYHLIADNVKRIWIGPGGATSRTFTEGWQEMGLFDFFQLLQKTYTDEQIISNEILRLDSEGFFNETA